jgi:hypothetical protein
LKSPGNFSLPDRKSETQFGETKKGCSRKSSSPFPCLKGNHRYEQLHEWIDIPPDRKMKRMKTMELLTEEKNTTCCPLFIYHCFGLNLHNLFSFLLIIIS